MSLISINNINKTYKSGEETVLAVNDISLSFEQGEFVAIVGPSGSGKSTLLTLLGGLNHPTSGKIIVDDIDIYSLSEERLADFRREYLGFIFQSFQLITYLTVLENVMIPLTITNYSKDKKIEMALEILDRVDLKNKISRLPGELSGGEQERVAIARALVNDPPVVLADEPTGNLDSSTSMEIMKLFKSLNKEGQTIIMVTHNFENLIHVQKVIQFRDGSIIDSNSFKESEFSSEQKKQFVNEINI